MASQAKLSPSTIGLFMECPRCFWRQVNLGIRRPAGVFPSLPGGMDRILKEHFDEHRSSSTAPEELAGFQGRLFPDEQKLAEWRNNRKGLQFVDQKTGITLMGALDDLFLTEAGEHAPLDFKTRGYPRKDDTHQHYQHQMDIYSFLLEKNGLKPTDFAILIFYHPKRVTENHHVEFVAEPLKIEVDRMRGERLFSDAAGCMLGPEPMASPSCEYCNW